MNALPDFFAPEYYLRDATGIDVLDLDVDEYITLVLEHAPEQCRPLRFDARQERRDAR